MAENSEGMDAPAPAEPVAVEAPAQASIEAPEHPASYFDGSSNRKRRVALRFGDDLEIVEDDAVAAVWPYDSIRRVDGPPNLLRLSNLAALPLSRLEIPYQATAQALLSRAPALEASAANATPTWRIVTWSLAAVGSILAVVFFGIPLAAERLAPLVPPRFEKRMGETVERQVRYLFDGSVCTDAAGQAAFNVLIDKLKQAGNIETTLDSQVLRTKVPVSNALALPGGKIYLLDGLLQKANNVDEIAGVLAHELGHVQHRDNMRRMIQTGGTSYLVGLLFGDIMGGSAVIFVSKSLLDASHSRDAELSADAFAIDVMQKLGRSARPMGEFLVRITDRPLAPSKSDTKPDIKPEAKPDAKAAAKPGASIFASHPLSADRLERMKQADRPYTGPELLSPSQWRALKGICRPGQGGGRSSEETTRPRT
ncbi:MAG: peptidase Ste24p [Xanthobacteraceae bacterium]|nr:peptidase Ste24p [Xanthobacteraceae bacterium]